MPALDDDVLPVREGGHERLVGFLSRLTELQLTCSAEGAEDIDESVMAAAREFGGAATLLLVPERATLSVSSEGRTTTVNVRGFPEIFRMDQVAALKPLLGDVEAGRVGLDEADRRLVAIMESRPPYPWWLKFLGIVLFSVGFAPLVQATWYELGSTAVLAAVSGGLAVAANRSPRFTLVLPLVAATAVALVAAAVFARDPGYGGPVLLMLPALFYFIPGDYLSAAAAELAAGHVTTGAIRLVYSIFLLVQLYLGVLLGLALADREPDVLFDTAAPPELPVWVLVVSWIPFTVGSMLAFAIPLRYLPQLLLLVYLTVGVQTFLTHHVGEAGAAFAAATVLGAAASWAARHPAQPPRVLLLLPGFFTLTVGSLGLRGLTALAGGYSAQGFKDLTEMVTVVTAIAAGIFLGSVLTERKPL
ncbi:threonine/serine exporter family protein [Streptomyces sp. NPDC060194]|uniref:threonine/serine exporter family protein n=1 Tax=Streptomyces sp. NPDC060194 TaxID=3347069 RepID=UPI00364A8E2B